MNAIENFLAELRANGLNNDGPIVADGKVHRIKADGDRAKNSWYIFHPATGTTPAIGVFGCWKRDFRKTWCEKRRERLTEDQWRVIRKAWKLADNERNRSEAERHSAARETAERILNASKPATTHIYLELKGVKVFGDVREYHDALVLPLRDIDGELHSLQFIGVDGVKKFLSGGRCAGCFFTLVDKPDGALVIAEGFATAASIAEVTGLASVAAMNAGNLLTVSKALREKFPSREIIIAADNDAWTDGNPGLAKATEAAKAIRAKLAVPHFINTEAKPTDFNDLHKTEGIHTVKTLIESANNQDDANLGQDGHVSATPSQWFSEKYPALVDVHGSPVHEEEDADGTTTVKDISEDFLAATLGEIGNPNEPTVFMPTEEKFYKYSVADGIYNYQQEPLLSARLSRVLLECARACGETCRTELLAFRFRDSGHLSGVLKKARGILPVSHDFFSKSLHDFVPCANGMLRLQDKELLPFSPSYRRRNKLAVRYLPGAKCPKFLETLMQAALDADDLDLLQRWAGLALIGENLSQKLMILSGTAGGGKGTFINVLVGIIGQINIGSLRPHLLNERFELGRLLGKTLLYGADVPDNFLNQRGASVLKSLTGFDPVTLEFKNSNEQPSIICRFNIIVTCNSRLTVHLEGDTEAWRRRLAIIEYRRPKPQNVIADLGQRILAEEAPGVLNWMLEGQDKIRAAGWQLRLSERQQTRVDNLLLESDGHSVFARECLRREVGGQVTAPECFAAYVEFCTGRGWAALQKNKFASLIGDVIVHQFGLTPRHDIRDDCGKSQRGWRGIALVENSPQPTEENVSEVSERPVSDRTDTILPIHPVNFDLEEVLI